MGVCYYLVDHINKKLIDMNKAFPHLVKYDLDFEKQDFHLDWGSEEIKNNEMQYYTHWFGRAINYIVNHPNILYEIINDGNQEGYYCELREKGYEVI